MKVFPLVNTSSEICGKMTTKPINHSFPEGNFKIVLVRRSCTVVRNFVNDFIILYLTECIELD